MDIMVLPATAARLWVRDIECLLALTMTLALRGSIASLLISFHAFLLASPAVVLFIGVLYVAPLILATAGVLAGRIGPRWHLEA